MNKCEEKCGLYKLDNIVCEEDFSLQDIEENISIIYTGNSQALTPDSRIDYQASETTVEELECVIQDINDLTITVELEFFVIKKIVIIRPGQDNLDMEFSFNKVFNIEISNCNHQIINNQNKDHLNCYIWNLEATDIIDLNIVEETFTDTLNITGSIKIIKEEQKVLCAKEPIKPPIEIIIALGKIRAVIPSGEFKDELIKLLGKVNCLLLSGCISDALAIITTMIEKIKLKYLGRYSTISRIKLVIDDLVKSKQAIIDELCR